ncbi:DUF2239 family protein, partial [Pseudomonas aeruginosa]
MANDPYIQSFTCFDGTRRLLTAALPEVALALKQAVAGGAAGPLLVFDNATGRSVDLDIRGSSEDLPVSYTHLRAHETLRHLVCR